MPLCLLVLVVSIAVPASAQTPDTILINGKILTRRRQFDRREAIAIRGGRIQAIGSTADIRKLAGPSTRVIDLQGRTVIPGPDRFPSPRHSRRAELQHRGQLDRRALARPRALGRIRDAARTMKPGSWLIVAGGWNVQQFEENRRPTQAELIAAAPEQSGLCAARVWLGDADSAGASRRSVITSDADLPSGGRSNETQWRADGRSHGRAERHHRAVRSTAEADVRATGRGHEKILPRAQSPGADRRGRSRREQPDCPRLPGALQGVARQGDDRARGLHAERADAGKGVRGAARSDGLLPMGFGDDMLRFNGLGERITVAMNNNNAPAQADKDAYYRIVKWAAERGMSLTMHWGNDASVDHLLSSSSA